MTELRTSVILLHEIRVKSSELKRGERDEAVYKRTLWAQSDDRSGIICGEYSGVDCKYCSQTAHIRELSGTTDREAP